MVVACIARNWACLDSLAKVVEDVNLRFKKIKTTLNIHRFKTGVNVYMTSLPSLVSILPLNSFQQKM